MMESCFVNCLYNSGEYVTFCRGRVLDSATETGETVLVKLNLVPV